MSALIGRHLGQYEIVNLLGKGGMAAVYLGRQASINRYVAVKVLSQNPALDEQFKERFRLEAEIIGNLQHPHILPLYDYGADGDILYLVMAYVEDGALEDLIERGPMQVRDVEKILRALAGALDYAHQKGVIHRDIKPANILMSNGNPLLADFGMVKILESGKNLTGTGIVGTPAYIAPEQAQSLPIDSRVDIYALGVTVYEMLTGMQPFTGDSALQVILAHVNTPPPDVRERRPELSADVAQVMYKAMAKNPDDRYQTASEFAEDFSRALHKNSETLAEIQRQFPLRDTITAKVPAVTVEFRRTETTEAAAVEPEPEKGAEAAAENKRSPLVMIGVVGLAAALVAITLIVLSGGGAGSGAGSGGNGEDATEQVAAATPTVEAVVVPPVERFGEVRFSTDAALGDRVEVVLNGVAPLGAGAQYAAWLMNSTTDEILALGRVVVNSFGEGTTAYTDADGRMLPALYNAVIITRETTIGDAPAGEVLYNGFIPPAISAALGEIFVVSEDGLDNRGQRTSLLGGALIEANFAIDHAGLAARATNRGGVLTHAEHTINILRGEQADYNGNGRGENPGRGVGVYFFLDQIDTRLNDALNQPGVSTAMQANGEFIRICTQNVRDWSEQVIVLEQEMIALSLPEDATVDAVVTQATASTEAAAQIVGGVDSNQNGQIEPFEGECGLAQLTEYGLQLARIDVVAGGVGE